MKVGDVVVVVGQNNAYSRCMIHSGEKGVIEREDIGDYCRRYWIVHLLSGEVMWFAEVELEVIG